MFLVHGKGYLELLLGVDYRISEHAQRGAWSSQSMVSFYPYEIGPGMVHRLYTREDDCLVVEVSTTELDDVVRIEDDYGRG